MTESGIHWHYHKERKKQQGKFYLLKWAWNHFGLPLLKYHFLYTESNTFIMCYTRIVDYYWVCGHTDIKTVPCPNIFCTRPNPKEIRNSIWRKCDNYNQVEENSRLWNGIWGPSDYARRPPPDPLVGFSILLLMAVGVVLGSIKVLFKIILGHFKSGTVTHGIISIWQDVAGTHVEPKLQSFERTKPMSEGILPTNLDL